MAKVNFKALAILGTGLGFLGTIISNYVSGKELDEKVTKAVAEALEKTKESN